MTLPAALEAARAMPLPEPTEAERRELATLLAGRMCGACKAYREHQELADAVLAWL